MWDSQETELITRYNYNEILTNCCFNVRPASVTLADIKPAFGECAVLAVKALAVNMWGDMSLWNVQGPLLHSGDTLVQCILTADYLFKV